MKENKKLKSGLSISLLGMLTFLLLSFSYRSEKELPIELKIVVEDLVKLNGNQYEYQDSIYKVSDFYISKYEVSNDYYKTFLSELKSSNKPDLYNLCRRDTSVWQDLIYRDYYHAHPKYSQYPVIGVSFDAAQEFCSWLTEKYNSNQKRNFKSVQFYLPSNIEWLIGANYEFHFPNIQYCVIRNREKLFTWGTKSVYSEKGELLGNFNIPAEYFIKFKSEIIAPINAFDKNEIGLFCMSGNVSEMTNIEGIAKGGSWKDEPSDSYIGSFQKYEAPSANVGFRICMRIIEE